MKEFAFIMMGFYIGFSIGYLIFRVYPKTRKKKKAKRIVIDSEGRSYEILNKIK